MLVMLAYDVPETRHQTFLRTEFERLGGHRVQYSLYLFEGEPHECDRIIRYMQRVAHGIVGDIRLLPMENSIWDAQIIIAGIGLGHDQPKPFHKCIEIW